MQHVDLLKETTVDDIFIEQSDLPEGFSRSVANGFKRLSFAPGEYNGQPVDSVIRIEVSYDN